MLCARALLDLMGLLSEKEFFCPYCGSGNNIFLEGGQGRQYRLVVDCETCCRPIVIQVRVIGRECELEVRAENE